MVLSKRFLFVTLVCGLGLVLSCQPPDCDRPDCGTCGNACCTLELVFTAPSEKVFDAYVDGLKRGGDDGRYTFIGSDDLRKYKVKADFILQGWHRTKEQHYNDTLNFAFSTMDSFCLVKAFSISQIAGAFCDAGQNYKNLIGLTKNLGMDFTQHTVSGCPSPNPLFN
nr:uncharacterized protein LOC129273082 [Lytechinus pictus]